MTASDCIPITDGGAIMAPPDIDPLSGIVPCRVGILLDSIEFGFVRLGEVLL